jgi:oxygen-independent coproporphyrinogen-3 oxidase
VIERALALAGAHPHDFTLQYPPRREYFMERYRSARPSAPFAGLRELLLYVHVPFCAHRCAYCNFAVDLSRDVARMTRYVEAVERALQFETDATIGGIDIGGGTPTRLPPDLLDRLLRAVRRFATPRVSIETTPEIAATMPETIAVLRDHAVERVSVGLQSSDKSVLRSMRRWADVEVHARALEALRQFPRVNVDIVFALPGQDRAAWIRDVEHAIALRPDSITTYDCLYRGKGRAMTRRSMTAPSPSTYGAMYDDAHAMLREAGYHAPYGSVNFSRHPGETGTSAYFERRLFDGWPYLGIGTYATSHVGDVWTFETAGVDAYLNCAAGDSYLLPRAETIAKYSLLALSFGRLDRARFQRRFGETIEERYGERLAVAIERGWLTADYEIRDFAALPNVRALLYTPEAIEWLAG